jgi:hypothetical protein
LRQKGEIEDVDQIESRLRALPARNAPDRVERPTAEQMDDNDEWKEMPAPKRQARAA